MKKDNQRDRFTRSRAFAYTDTPHAQVSRSGFYRKPTSLNFCSSQREVVARLGLDASYMHSSDTREENETATGFLNRMHFKRMMNRENKMREETYKWL